MTYAMHKVEIDDKRRISCPVCGSRDCTLCDRDNEIKEYFEFYLCEECGQEFTEVYEYKHTEYSKEA